MTRISTGPPKSGAPLHPNKYAFHHNPSSKRTLHIYALPISSALCPTCVSIMEWRKKYRKYKPLTVPKRCTACNLKNAIKDAYHVICTSCAIKDKKCAKCRDLRSLDINKQSAKLEADQLEKLEEE